MSATSLLQMPAPCCHSSGVRVSARPSACSSQALSFRSSVSSIVAFRPQHQVAHRGCRLQRIECAISRATKEKRVAELEEVLKTSSIAFGVRYNKVKVADFEAFRRSLPAEAKMYVAKNTLMRLASQRVDGWSSLTQSLTLEHAWVFAPEEAIAASVKAFLDFEAKLLEPFPKAERSKMQLTDIAAGMMGGTYLEGGQVRKLDKMPTKQQLMQAVAVMIKKVPTKVAVSIKQVPTKLAYGIKALAEGDDNKDLKVGDVFPKAKEA